MGDRVTTRVVIFRASSRLEVGAVSHLPIPEHASWQPERQQTVLRTVCGLTGIGRTFDREDLPGCAECCALTGHHPGPRGMRSLQRLYGVGR